MDEARECEAAAGMDEERECEAAAWRTPDGMHTDEYIRIWQPLMPLDRDRLTPEQVGMIMQKLYRRSAVVYNRLAEL